MSDIVLLHINLIELSHATNAPTELLINLVEHGIVEPKGQTPNDWEFDNQMVYLIKKAIRLQQDLDIDWPGIAFALELLAEINTLKQEKTLLQQRLDRFLFE